MLRREMIDFNNASFVKLRPLDDRNDSIDQKLLLPDEEVLQAFQGVRDMVGFTASRIIPINVQGITGKKKDLLHCLTAGSRRSAWRLPEPSTWMQNLRSGCRALAASNSISPAAMISPGSSTLLPRAFFRPSMQKHQEDPLGSLVFHGFLIFFGMQG